MSKTPDRQYVKILSQRISFYRDRKVSFSDQDEKKLNKH